MRFNDAGKALFATIALLLAAPALADDGDAQRG
ncbi:MAG: hypothetical protein HW417_1093, partial [Steroidobacteraceae bacterium]|nr:hypothetical protein [Steroidobacteraceae bacterium]